MYRTWHDLVDEYRYKDDGARRTRKQIAEKIAADSRAHDPSTNKEPEATAVLRRLNEKFPGWYEDHGQKKVGHKISA
jgi:hypothetical protein